MFEQFKTAKMPKNQQSIFRAFSDPFSDPFLDHFPEFLYAFFHCTFFNKFNLRFCTILTLSPHFFLMYTCWQRLQTLCLSIFNFCVVLCISEDLANSHETWDGVKFTDGWQSVLRDPKRVISYSKHRFCKFSFVLYFFYCFPTFQVLFLLSRLCYSPRFAF